jgi:hypothetical protein
MECGSTICAPSSPPKTAKFMLIAQPNGCFMSTSDRQLAFDVAGRWSREQEQSVRIVQVLADVDISKNKVELYEAQHQQ